MLSEELIKTLREAEEACVCKFCGRCVLAGPPCCYQKVYNMYEEILKERDWLRKVQSKKDKQINDLKNQIEALKGK
jgi:hypothetical protein